jgi:hypothetical protein
MIVGHWVMQSGNKDDLALDVAAASREGGRPAPAIGLCGGEF